MLDPSKEEDFFFLSFLRDRKELQETFPKGHILRHKTWWIRQSSMAEP